MITIDNKYELGQEVYVIRKARVSHKCPACDGNIVEKHSKRGKVFYGCSNYPKCKMAYWDKPTGETCPECGAMLTEKNKKIKCSSCSYTEN